MCLPEQDSQQQHMTRAGGGGKCITTNCCPTINSLHHAPPSLQSAVRLEAVDMDAEDLSNSKPGSCHSCHQCSQQPGPAQQGVELAWQGREDCKQVLLPRRPARTLSTSHYLSGHLSTLACCSPRHLQTVFMNHVFVRPIMFTH